MHSLPHVVFNGSRERENGTSSEDILAKNYFIFHTIFNLFDLILANYSLLLTLSCGKILLYMISSIPSSEGHLGKPMMN